MILEKQVLGRLTAIVMMVMGLAGASAQEYVVKSVTLAEGDQTAVEQQRLDLLKNPCALVKVLAADQVVKVDGNVIGDVARHGSYTWIYITDGTKRIDLHFEKHLTLSVYFPDYEVKIKSSSTYVMQLAEKKGNADKQTVIERDTTTGQGMYDLAMDYWYGRNSQPKDVAQSLYWMQKSADIGHAAGLNALGVCYKNGDGVERDYAKAMHLFQQASAKGECKGYYNIGVLYENGLGLERDYAKAMENYRKSAAADYKWGNHAVGMMYYSGRGVSQDYAEAVKWLQKAADQGLAVSQYQLALCYHEGKGVAMKSPPDALYWFKKAADQKNARAMCYLGYYYEKGLTTNTPNAEQAVYWYEQAANAGDKWAMRNMGVMYEMGIGVEVDFAKAVQWYRKAAEQGESNAQVYLGNAYSKGNGVEQDYKQATEWFQKAADQNNAEGYYRLAWCYYYGRGVEKDSIKHIEYLEKAAEMGDDNAQQDVGDSYLFGQRGFKKDYKKAFQWLKRAADQGNIEAAAQVGACYYEGWGTAVDKDKAIAYCREAVDAGNKVGQYNLALILSKEENPDFSHIFDLLEKSAQQNYDKAYLLLGVYWVAGFDVVSPNIKYGVMLIKQAASLGNEQAAEFMSKSGLQGLSDDEMNKNLNNWATEQKVKRLIESMFFESK